MVSIATEELKYEGGHLPPPPATLLVLNEVWALGTYEYFQAFPVVLEKICLTVSKMFSCVCSQIICIYQLQQNKSKFLDCISESFLRKGISWIVEDLTFSVYMILEDNLISLFGYSICVWCLKLCISFIWKYENVKQNCYFYARSAENFEILLLQWPEYLPIL